MQTHSLIQLPPQVLAFLAAFLDKEAKETRDALAPQDYVIDDIVTLRLDGVLRVGKDHDRAPTCKIPLLASLALMVKRMGIQKEAALEVLREVMTEALTMEKDATAELLAETGVADAEKLIRDAVISKLPKDTVAGKVTTKGMVGVVGVPISEPAAAE